METMVERVARAIWAERVRHAKDVDGIDLEAWGQRTGFLPVDGGEPDVAALNNIVGEARAAIEAMRTPTEAMITAFWEPIGDEGHEIWNGPDVFKRGFASLIDAALLEKE